MSKKKKFNKYLRKGGRFLLRKKIIQDAQEEEQYSRYSNNSVMTDQEIKDYPHLNPSTGRFWGDTIDIEDIKRQIVELEKKENN